MPTSADQIVIVGEADREKELSMPIKCDEEYKSHYLSRRRERSLTVEGIEVDVLVLALGGDVIVKGTPFVTFCNYYNTKIFLCQPGAYALHQHWSNSAGP